MDPLPLYPSLKNFTVDQTGKESVKPLVASKFVQIS